MTPLRPFNRRGIAIGPILMIIALVAVIMGAMAVGSGDIGGAMSADTASAELRGQIDMVRAKIQECVFITRQRAPVALQADPVTGLMPADTRTDLQKGYQYPSSGTLQDWAAGITVSAGTTVRNGGRYYAAVSGGVTGGSSPTHTSGMVTDGGVMWDYLDNTPIQTVRGLECPRDPAGRRNLWTGMRPANLPSAPRGFSEWVYIDHGDPADTDPGGTCIRIRPLPSAAADARIREAIAKAIKWLSPGEAEYNAGSADQTIIIWLRRPRTGNAC